MQTSHKVINTNSNNISMVPDKSIQLIVSSPPYPMVEMWDDGFIKQDAEIKTLMENERYADAFEKMHNILNSVWAECERVLVDGGFACINIGDATRTFNGKFQLFSNHAKVIECFQKLGFTLLPDIHWRKATNSPNKFMGSGMYPAGAYVTYEHEYILIFRKGEKRIFDKNERAMRQNSAYFWEERNIWFSDLWSINGTKQDMPRGFDRKRNGAYPIEVPYRLISMYSIYGDTVLDPFGGLGTTSIAAMLSGRNSISVDISSDFCTLMQMRLTDADLKNKLNNLIENRISQHENFINTLPKDKKSQCYANNNHHFAVKTKQEIDMRLYKIKDILQDEAHTCIYEAIKNK